jgi:Domain of unknown function (DUF5668)/B-box zinc finger
MNCANHADASAVAYCRTCGKPLCANCTRPVRGVIYCEDCLGARMETPAAPGVPPGFVPGTYSAAPGRIPAPPVHQPGSGSGPNPTVAGILAGFFPFGVGAVYTGQYAKGLAHLAVFALLIAGCNAADNSHSDALGVICGLGLAFFYVYQIIDAVRSARAIQTAQPVPDPFGLAATFGGGAKIETSKIPVGAIVLIGIGLLFLLHTMGLTEFGLDRFWPLILIGLGAWLFARNWGLMGARCFGCQCARCRARRLMGPAMLLTIGGLFQLESLHIAYFSRTWPVILLVVGAVKLMQGSASTEGHNPVYGPGAPVAGGPIPPTPPIPPAPPIPPVPPTGEVNRG